MIVKENFHSYEMTWGNIPTKRSKNKVFNGIKYLNVLEKYKPCK